MNKNEPELPVRQLIKFSNYSLCITLPKDFIDNLGWQQGDRITFELSKDKQNIILAKEQPKTISQKENVIVAETLIMPSEKTTHEPEKNTYKPRETAENNNLQVNLDNLEPIPQLN